MKRRKWRIGLQSECAAKRDRLRAVEDRLRALPEADAEGERAALERAAALLRRRLTALAQKRPRPSPDGVPLVENRSSLVLSVLFLEEHARLYDLSRLAVALAEMDHLCPGPVDGYYRRPPKGTRGWLHSIVCVVDPSVGYPTWAVPDVDKLGVTWPDIDPDDVGCVEDLEEAGVVILFHELFHFLRSTRQVPQRNTEPHANAFAWESLLRFRAWRADGGAVEA